MGKEPNLPNWLSAFLAGGIEEAEKIGAYAGKYLFVTVNEGANFALLNKWADNFSVEYDFPMLAAARIEKRMNASNSLYPDDEYGIFYQQFIKNAYSGEYQGTVKEDVYWIKTKAAEGDNANSVGQLPILSDFPVQENAALPEVFIFYVLISIDAQAMQATVNNLFSQAFILSAPTRTRAAAINRLRQNFFEGF